MACAGSVCQYRASTERVILSARWACQGVQHAQLVVYALRVFYLQNTGDGELGGVELPRFHASIIDSELGGVELPCFYASIIDSELGVLSSLLAMPASRPAMHHGCVEAGISHELKADSVAGH